MDAETKVIKVSDQEAVTQSSSATTKEKSIY